VELDPIQALSRVTSWRSKVSLRKLVLITMGSKEERGRGSPLTLRFSYHACLVLSSMSLACTTSSTATRGGGGTFLPLTTCAHELMCLCFLFESGLSSPDLLLFVFKIKNLCA
jgi:hypothetical protein